MRPEWKPLGRIDFERADEALSRAGVGRGPMGPWTETTDRMSQGTPHGHMGPMDRAFSAATATHVVSVFRDGNGEWYGDAQPWPDVEWAAGLNFPPYPPA